MRLIHFDLNVIPVLIQRGWSIIAGAITLVVVPLWLSKIEQGYYYTFLSLVALQVFFELGLNTVVVQFSGHEVAHSELSDDGWVHGNLTYNRRFQSLVSLLRRWYKVTALLFFILVTPIGYWFFSHHGALVDTAWMGAWVGLVLATAINLYLSWQLALMEGIGCVRQVARMRLVQSMLGYGFMWIALAKGAGLYAIPLVPCVAVGYSWYRLQHYRRLFKSSTMMNLNVPKEEISWRKEIFPLQWRIALSWASGYFIFNAFTPLIFANLGAVEAGRFGLALTIFSSITNLGTSWTSSNIAKMTGMIARHEWLDLKNLFKVLLKSSLFFTFAACGIFMLIMEAAFQLGLAITDRVSGWPVLLCLAVVALANSFIASAAIYMRSHKVEPMLIPSVVGGVLNLGAAYYGSMYSENIVALLYACLTCFIGVPWTYFVLKKYYPYQNN